MLIWSGLHPKDNFTWFLEVVPALIGAVALYFTYKTFPLTPLLYLLILLHCIILMVGGHYTYAEVPFPDIFSNLFGAGRNNYDKIGHLAQGFVPAILAREILLRKKIIRNGSWLAFIVIAICLAFSALYEIVECLVSIATGENGEAFLGTQGYIWDTQTDMAMALVGAIFAIVSLTQLHNQQLRKMENTQ